MIFYERPSRINHLSIYQEIDCVRFNIFIITYNKTIFTLIDNKYNIFSNNPTYIGRTIFLFKFIFTLTLCAIIIVLFVE